ncbi:hypothetical protein LEP1GSC193_2505 [Leptospira alstonii serovar Pingchang str. 80-412]|uniref:Uncharacterized protein n=2 Tax=Leptospira alstonii TaxID=28452 RepID=M6D251_9LEPT|nr:hypothetical protein LEP1GSC194_2544 [Leptospira alstonii serovar Sichuan str. 79601]EQA81023.1 hypothetical protein LEP1GSC193_2505 [Leptospira alstonii serovar Pingchang str. 80-412]
MHFIYSKSCGYSIRYGRKNFNLFLKDPDKEYKRLEILKNYYI